MISVVEESNGERNATSYDSNQGSPLLNPVLNSKFNKIESNKDSIRASKMKGASKQVQSITTLQANHFSQMGIL